MKTKLLTITTILAIGAMTSCGRPKTDDIGVESQLVETKTVNEFQLTKEIDPEVRKGTIVIFPAGDDLKGFSYEFPEEQWTPVIAEGRLPYGKQLPRVIKAEASNSDKIKDLVNVILSIGKLKDISFRLYKSADMKGDLLKEQKKQLVASVACFEIKEGENEGKCKVAPDETTSEKAKRAKRTCKNLGKHLDKFIELTDEQNATFAGLLQKCGAIEGGEKQVKAGIRKIKTITDMGESLAVDVSTAYGDHIGKNHLPLVASQSRQAPDGFEDSTIVFNEDFTKVEELKLAINFGGGNEYPTYSIENGKIINVKLDKTSRGNKYLEFTINGPIVIVAKLSVTKEVIFMNKDGSGPSFTNLRIKGTTDNIFPDGTVKKGVMALDMDTLD